MGFALNVQIVVAAICTVGDEADLRDIYRGVQEFVPDWRNRYKSEESFEGTIRATIEEFCPQSEKYKQANEALFSRVSPGRYRVLDPSERESARGRTI
jgi:hypothetical protein